MTSEIEIGLFVTMMFLLTIASLHGYYVFLVDYFGETRWTSRGEHVVVSLICALFMTLLLFSKAVGWIIVNYL